MRGLKDGAFDEWKENVTAMIDEIQENLQLLNSYHVGESHVTQLCLEDAGEGTVAAVIKLKCEFEIDWCNLSKHDRIRIEGAIEELQANLGDTGDEKLDGKVIKWEGWEGSLMILVSASSLVLTTLFQSLPLQLKTGAATVESMEPALLWTTIGSTAKLIKESIGEIVLPATAEEVAGGAPTSSSAVISLYIAALEESAGADEKPAPKRGVGKETVASLPTHFTLECLAQISSSFTGNVSGHDLTAVGATGGNVAQKAAFGGGSALQAVATLKQRTTQLGDSNIFGRLLGPTSKEMVAQRTQMLEEVGQHGNVTPCAMCESDPPLAATWKCLVCPEVHFCDTCCKLEHTSKKTRAHKRERIGGASLARRPALAPARNAGSLAGNISHSSTDGMDGGAESVSSNAPNRMKCPITRDLMLDPVVMADGVSYERKAIVEWLQSNDTSPLTNKKLSHFNSSSNLALKEEIEELKSSVAP
jgi:hypothetical protein